MRFRSREQPLSNIWEITRPFYTHIFVTYNPAATLQIVPAICCQARTAREFTHLSLGRCPCITGRAC
jgi:hypothetical protein